MSGRLWKILAILAFGLFFLPQTATAQSIITPNVFKGRVGFEVKNSYKIDNDDEINKGAQSRFETSYGATDWMLLQGGVLFLKTPGEEVQTGAVFLDSKIKLAPTGSWLFDPAIRLRYSHYTNTSPDEMEFKFIGAKQLDSFYNVANVTLKRQVGDDADNDMDYGLSLGSSYVLSDTFKVGLELYTDFGDFTGKFSSRTQQLGPVATGKIGVIGYQTGLLFGLTDNSPDAQIKLNLDYRFNTM